jgi:hypothetical protein
MKPLPERRVTLIVPGLFGNVHAPADDDRLPAVTGSLPRLARFLARSDHHPNPLVGFEPRLFGFFGVAATGKDLPVAAVTRIADVGVVDREWWVRADPVYLEPRRDSLVLRAALDLTPAESDQLASELSETLAADGWRLRAPCPQRWYLKPPRASEVVTTPLAQAIGRDIHPLLPQGKDGLAWHTRLNEIQILLHTSPVNAAREERGVWPANSVWFWGGGRLPELGDSHWAQVWSDEPLGQGFSRLASVPAAGLPEGGEAWLRMATLPGEHLVVLDAMQRAVLRGDAEAWRESIGSLEADWLAPLMTAVHRGRLAELMLCADCGSEFRYSRAHRWRFWRRPRSLTAYRAA